MTHMTAVVNGSAPLYDRFLMSGGTSPAASTPVSGRDEELYLRFRERADGSALGAIVERHWARTFRLAWRIVRDPALAEDVAQRVFVKVARGRGYRGDGPFAAWLGRIAVHEARDAIRVTRRRAGHERAAAAARGATSRAPGTGDSDLAVALDEHLARLPEDLRVPLVLRYAEGFTHEEVAGALGLASGTASSRLRRGLELLRGSLAAAGVSCTLSIEGVEAALRTGLRSAPPAPSAPSTAVLLRRAGTPARATLLLKCAAAVGMLVLIGGLAVGVRRAQRPSREGPGGAMQGAVTAETAPRTRPGEASRGGEAGPSGGDPSRGAATAGPPALPGADPRPAADLPFPGATLADAPRSGDLVAKRWLLEGRVVSAVDGSPVGGADVALSLLAGHTRGEAMTSADGAFRIAELDGFTAPKLRLLMDRAGLSAMLTVRKDGMAPLFLPLSPDDLGSGAPLEARMASGDVRISGRVVSRSSRVAIPGVTIRIAQSFGEEPCEARIVTRTSAMGEFTARGFCPGPIALTIEDTGFETTKAEVLLGPSGRDDIELEVREAMGPAAAAPPTANETANEPEKVPWRIAGRVVGADGDPVSHAALKLSGMSGEEFEVWELETSEDGRFAFDVPTSKFFGGLDVSAGGFVKRSIDVNPWARLLHRDGVVPGESVRDLLIRLERRVVFAVEILPPASWPTARFVRALEAKLASVEAHAEIEPTETGRVRVEIEAPGSRTRGTLALRLPGGAGLVIEGLLADAEAPVISYPDGPGAILHGQALLPDGAPASGAKVEILDAAGDPLGLFECTTTTDGAFLLTGLPRGRLSLLILHGAVKLRLSIDTKDGAELGSLRLESPVAGE